MRDNKLTDWQVEALDAAVVQARGYGVEIGSRNQFDLKFHEEVRPGRGCDVTAFYVDGDHVITGYIDVYGNGAGVSVGEVVWEHSAGDEDCECGPCWAEADA